MVLQTHYHYISLIMMMSCNGPLCCWALYLSLGKSHLPTNNSTCLTTMVLTVTLTLPLLASCTVLMYSYIPLEKLIDDTIAQLYAYVTKTISLHLTKLYVTRSFALASSVTYSEIRQNFSNSAAEKNGGKYSDPYYSIRINTVYNNGKIIINCLQSAL